MTKRDFYQAVANREVITDEMVSMALKAIEQLDNRNANRKPSKVQVANEALKAQIVEIMTGAEPMTATEILKALNDDSLSNQKVSSMLRQLKLAEVVKPTVDKRKTYFSLA